MSATYEGARAATSTLRRRLAVLHHHLGDPWPDVSDAALAGRLDEHFWSEERGLFADPPWFQLCLGVPWGAPATTEGGR